MTSKREQNVDRVVPIEFKLHAKARQHSDQVADIHDWFEMNEVFSLGKEFNFLNPEF